MLSKIILMIPTKVRAHVTSINVFRYESCPMLPPLPAKNKRDITYDVDLYLGAEDLDHYKRASKLLHDWYQILHFHRNNERCSFGWRPKFDRVKDWKFDQGKRNTFDNLIKMEEK